MSHRERRRRRQSIASHFGRTTGPHSSSDRARARATQNLIIITFHCWCEGKPPTTTERPPQPPPPHARILSFFCCCLLAVAVVQQDVSTLRMSKCIYVFTQSEPKNACICKTRSAREEGDVGGVLNRWGINVCCAVFSRLLSLSVYMRRCVPVMIRSVGAPEEAWEGGRECRDALRSRFVHAGARAHSRQLCCVCNVMMIIASYDDDDARENCVRYHRLCGAL